MTEDDMVSLANLGRGAAIERFDDEFKRVLANILDPNTTPGAREINLRVKIKPNEARDFCTVNVFCTSKVSAAKPFETQFFVGRDSRGIKATEHNPQQMKLGIDQPSGKVVNIQDQKGERP
jgi:hypothetical protein